MVGLIHMVRILTWKPGSALFATTLVMLLVSLTLLCGCIEVGEKAGESSASSPLESVTFWNAPDTVSPTQPVTARESEYSSTATNPAPTEEAMLPGSAVYADPIPPAIATNLSYRELDHSTEFFPRPFDYPTAPFFQGAYALSWNNVGILASPSEPPFVIEFKVDAGTTNPYDAQVVLTVRDNRTGLIIAEDGYNGPYSSESVKRITIREAGEYHINMYGYRATIHLVLRGGVPEEKAVPYGIFFTPVSSPRDEYSEEYEDEW
ncbi:MAG: hypothetical protein A4E38_00081 [Methanoregulaceae archaeon PtaB.Bin108]|nr:MAG: hypothetical protein A4E38_00081 [Methanoregulaceae archaeon PtaB.Bin108]